LIKECEPEIPARLLFVYFYGENRDGFTCPQSKAEWLATIAQMNERLGVDTGSQLMKRVHHVFLPVNPAGVGVRKKSNGG